MTRMGERMADWWRSGAVLGMVGALVATLMPMQSWAQGCAMCATYLSNGHDPRADAFKISIMFLMAMPFVVVATAGGWIVWMHRRARTPLPTFEAEEEGVS
jgi:hypothetical protein